MRRDPHSDTVSEEESLEFKESKTTRSDLVQLLLYDTVDRSLIVISRFFKLYIISKNIPGAVGAGLLANAAYALGVSFISAKLQDQPRLAQQFGKLTLEGQNTPKERAEIGRIYQQSSLLALCISVPSVLVSYYLTGPIFSLMGVPRETIDLEKEITSSLVFSLPFDFMSSADRSLFKTSSYRIFFAGSTTIRQLSDIGLTAILVPRLGLKGVGYASLFGALIEWTYNKAIIIATPKFRKNFKVTNLWMLCQPCNFEYFRSIFVESVPIFTATVSFFGAQLVFSGVIAKLGDDRAQLYNVMGTWVSIFEVIPRSIINASGVFVAKALGEQAYPELRRYGNLPLYVAAGWTVLEILSVYLFSGQLTNVFVDATNFSDFVKDNMVWLYILFILGSSCSMLQDGLNSNLQSIRATLYSFTSTFITILMILPGAFLTTLVLNLDLFGPDSAQFVGYALSAFYLTHFWKKHSSDEQTLQELAEGSRSDLSSFSVRSLCQRVSRLGCCDRASRSQQAVEIVETDQQELTDSNPLRPE